MKAMEIRKDWRYIFESLMGCTADDKDFRKHLMYIYHDEERNVLVATNGRAMLVWKIPEAESFKDMRDFMAGEKFLDYDKGILYTKEFDGKYVDWWRVVPDTGKREQWKLASGEFSGKKARASQMKLYVSLLHLGLYFNYDYIETVKVSFSSVYVRKDSPCMAVTNDESFRLILMPMQGDDMERIA